MLRWVGSLIVLVSTRPGSITGPVRGHDLQETWLALQRELAMFTRTERPGCCQEKNCPTKKKSTRMDFRPMPIDFYRLIPTLGRKDFIRSHHFEGFENGDLSAAFQNRAVFRHFYRFVEGTG